MFDRRLFLKSGAFALLSLGAGPGFLARAAAASAGRPLGSAARRPVLVTVFQRGAMDALAAVPPLADRYLPRLRPRLVLSGARRAPEGERLLDLDGRFGLHPALAPLAPFWRDGRLAVVHGVGSPDPTRSHFDAQDFMETGTPGVKSTGSGWLNRVAGRLGHDATPFRATALTRALPRSLDGPAPALAIEDLEAFRLGGRRGGREAAAGAGRGGGEGEGFESLYGAASEELLAAAGRDTFEALRLLDGAELASYRPAGGARYPRSPLGRALEQVAMLVKAGVGLEVAFAESGGWDTHVRQAGSFARRAGDLAASIAAFWTDLGEHRAETVVLTMTEFGRTVAENGSGGTDHGHGSCLFLLGEGVAGGRVHGTLPPLDPDALYEGRDLPVTTDFRAVFAEVAARHLGVTNAAAVFPGWEGDRIALWRG